MGNYNKLKENVEGLTNKKNQNVSFDINKFILPDKEVAKNYIKKNEKNISDEDADIMVEGFGTENDRKLRKRNKNYENVPSTVKNIEKLSSSANTEFKKQEMDRNVNDSLNEANENATVDDENDKIFKEAINIKKDTIEGSNNFFKKSGELLKEGLSLSITIGTLIPGSVLKLLPLQFNVPDSITGLLNQYDKINNFISKYESLIDGLGFINNLDIVLDQKSLNIVSAVLNTTLTTLNTTTSPILNSGDFLNQIIQKLGDVISDDKENERREYIKGRLSRTGYLENLNMDDVDSDDKEEVKNILQEWRVVNSGSSIKVERKQDLSEIKNKINTLSSNIEKSNDIKIKNTNITSNNNIIYDVQFPDGSVVYGLDVADIKGLENNFNLIFAKDVEYLKGNF